ncbi:nitroreductase/quinone reductase family protein [Patulibacter defluvii]|uniref:nitroreductase/quinone reductase family protein n=1 Tax=Patulibacter defluvii TaxID=3095358 RepID=UPI002A75D764|nr:nitroreductase/quinone reductase family protein [Patulibacter sp. DM4]
MSDLPRIDPSRDLSRPARAYAAVLRTPPGRWLAINVAANVDPWLMRVSRGKVGMGLMLPSALLTTKGAKSGQERVNPVLYFHDGDDVIVIASSFGRDKHPAWYHNLKANPEVRIAKQGGGTPRTAVEVTDPAEIARLWSQADRIYPPYANYRQRTDAVGRRIPIVRLTAG